MEAVRSGLPRFAQPLAYVGYRNVWMASIAAYFGQFILSVGAAWAMHKITRSAEMVALVQTAAVTPILLLAIPAGALADMYDRRLMMFLSLCFSLAGACALTMLAIWHLASPVLLLLLTFLVSAGGALFAPAWQASLRDQLPSIILPAGIALRSVAYNAGRSVGPALGGAIVAASGYVTAFAVSSLAYMPMLLLAVRSSTQRMESTHPPERIDQAVRTGFRYVAHAPTVRGFMIRVILYGLAGGGVAALTPLIASDILHGGAGSYGALLSAFGVGAVLGGLLVTDLQRRIPVEFAVTGATIIVGLGCVGIGFTTSLLVCMILLMVIGTAWMLVIALCNVAVQLRTPGWVAGRVVATFQASTAGGVAGGSWIWGRVSQHAGVADAMVISGCVTVVVSCLVVSVLRFPNDLTDVQPALNPLPELGNAVGLGASSGPIEIEIVYCVDPERAGAFLEIMRDVQHIRQRNGAIGWSLCRDVCDPLSWAERFVCRNWMDYLRQRTRATESEREVQRKIIAFQMDQIPLRIRRSLTIR